MTSDGFEGSRVWVEPQAPSNVVHSSIKVVVSLIVINPPPGIGPAFRGLAVDTRIPQSGPGGLTER